mgnify:CR=1 FL=1
MLTEQIVNSAITILEDGQLQIRRSRRIFDDGVQIAEQYHRHVVAPGDDVSGEDPRVRAVAALLHTPAVIAAYKAAQARNRP